MRDRNHILSLERGLKILEILGKSSQPLTLTGISNRIQLSKTTTQRFLNTLCSMGYLNRDESKRYTPTVRILSLGFHFLNSYGLTKVARPHIDKLSDGLKKTVNLAVLDHLEILYLYRKEVSRFLKFDLQAGSKLPVYCTAAGKVLLAGLENDELNKRIKLLDLKAITPKSITSKKVLREEIRKTRKMGYSICDRELSMDLYSLAVPIMNNKGITIAAMNITMNAGDGNPESRKTTIEHLIQTGEQISRLLGYLGHYPGFPS